MEKQFFCYRNMTVFRHAMLEKKHITIGFIGGSITDPRGRERWGEFLVSWLISDFPEVMVDVENVAIGATASDYAVIRVEKDLIPHGCDLIFIEYAVNDNKLSSDLRNASREGLIRKLLHGTQADIVIVYTYCADMLEPMLDGRMADSVAEFEYIARHYGISSVFMADYALHEVLRGMLRWEEWLPDGLHPENIGSRFYAKPVYELLKHALEDSDGTSLCRQTPEIFSDNWEFAETFPLDRVQRIGYWRLYRCLDLPLVRQILSSTCIGSRLRFSFTGTGLVLTLSFGWMAADYRWRINDGKWHTEAYERPEWMDDYNWLKTKTLIHGLKKGTYTAEFEILPPKADAAHKGTAFEVCAIGILKN